MFLHVGSGLWRGCVDHVGLFVEVFRRGGQRLGPYMLGVQWVVVKTQSLLCPIADDPAVCVVIDGVLLVVASHRAVTVVFLPKSALRTPSQQDGVPASEADSRREVFHDALQVVHAPACVNARPSLQMPKSKACPDLFMHVECGEASRVAWMCLCVVCFHSSWFCRVGVGCCW